MLSRSMVHKSVIHRGFRYRLSPTPEQQLVLGQFAGATRFVYNLALEQRRDFWRQYRATTGGALNYISQGREVTALRASCDWIAAVPSSAFTQALRDLDRAFAAFHRGAGFPSPRKRGFNDSFRVQAKDIAYRRLNGRWSEVWVPKLGWVKVRHTRDISGKTMSATFSRCGLGWHVSFTAEIEHAAVDCLLPAIGIDRGVANTVALSTGEMFSIPPSRAVKAKQRAQRTLARREKGSARYRKQKQRVAALSAKVARVRSDWRHKITIDIARRFGLAALEDLNTAGLTRAGRGKRGMNRSILEQGWRAFETVLAYKLEERGGRLVKVNPAYTSQECSACETIDKASRESQASYVCRSCGFAAHADTNAAINILRRSTALMRAEDGGCPTVETRTVTHAALAA
jgi:putative transposase